MKKWTGLKGVGWGERSGPGGKEWAGWERSGERSGPGGEGVGRGGRSGPGERSGPGGRSGPGRKEWARGRGVGRGERSWPGGKEWAGGEEWAGGWKESAGADWLVVRYISLLQDFLFDFFKKPFQETEPFHLTEAL